MNFDMPKPIVTENVNGNFTVQIGSSVSEMSVTRLQEIVNNLREEVEIYFPKGS